MPLQINQILLLGALAVSAAHAASTPKHDKGQQANIVAADSDGSMDAEINAPPSIYNFNSNVCHIRYTAYGENAKVSYFGQMGTWDAFNSQAESEPQQVVHHLVVPYSPSARLAALSAPLDDENLAFGARVVCTDAQTRAKYSDITKDASTMWRQVQPGSTAIDPAPLLACNQQRYTLAGVQPFAPEHPRISGAEWVGVAAGMCTVRTSDPQYQTEYFALPIQKLRRDADIYVPGKEFNFNGRGVCSIEMAASNYFWVDYSAGRTSLTYTSKFNSCEGADSDCRGHVHQMTVPFQAGQVIAVTMVGSKTLVNSLAARVKCTDGQAEWTDVSGTQGSKWQWSKVVNYDEVPVGPAQKCPCPENTCKQPGIDGGAQWIGGGDKNRACPIYYADGRSHVFHLKMPVALTKAQ